MRLSQTPAGLSACCIAKWHVNAIAILFFFLYLALRKYTFLGAQQAISINYHSLFVPSSVYPNQHLNEICANIPNVTLTFKQSCSQQWMLFFFSSPSLCIHLMSIVVDAKMYGRQTEIGWLDCTIILSAEGYQCQSHQHTTHKNGVEIRHHLMAFVGRWSQNRCGSDTRTKNSNRKKTSEIKQRNKT